MKSSTGELEENAITLASTNKEETIRRNRAVEQVDNGPRMPMAHQWSYNLLLIHSSTFLKQSNTHARARSNTIFFKRKTPKDSSNSLSKSPQVPDPNAQNRSSRDLTSGTKISHPKLSDSKYRKAKGNVISCIEIKTFVCNGMYVFDLIG